MFKLNCLLKDTTIIKSVTDYIEALIGEAKTVKEASINHIYTQAIKEGIEIDFESFAFAYSQVKTAIDPNEEFMTSDDAIKESIPKDIENAVNSILNDAKEKTISNLAPEKQVLLNVLKLFNTSIKEPGGKSIMRTLQDTVLKKTLSLLDKEILNKLAAKPTFDELIKSIVENNDIGIEKIDGSMNNIASLVKAVKEEISKIENKIPASKKAEFQQFTKEIENGLMDIVLSNSEIKSLINNSLIDNGFFKVVNGNKVVDWGKVMDGTTIENEKFEPISYDFNSLRDSIVKTLSKSTTPEWAESLADAIKSNIEDKIAEKKAKVLKIPKSAVQKLMTYSALAQDQMGKEASNTQNGNYLIELSKLLNIDKTLQHNIDPKAVADILELYNGLDKILSSTSAKDMTILLMTPTVKNWIDRQITKIINDHGLTLSNVDILARTLESFMVLKGLTLSNPYNIVQNITGNAFELIASLDALQEVFSKKGGSSSKFLNIDEIWANMKSVGSGEVENTGKANAAIDEIDLRGSMNTIASSEWKGGLKGKNVSDYAMWFAKKIKRISDVALNSFDAGGSSFLLNRYVLTTLSDLAYAKAKKEGAANPEEEVNKVIQAYLGQISNKNNIKTTLANVNEEVDKQIESGVVDIDQIRQNVLEKLGKDNKLVQNAIHVKFIMDRMGKSVTKDTNMARRLFYEVSRGTLVNDMGFDSSADTISQTGNTMALMLLGKKSDNNAFLGWSTKAMEGITGWSSDRLKKIKKEGNLKLAHVIENMLIRLNMLFVVGSTRWNVIASKFTPLGFYDAFHAMENKKAVRSSKNSEAYKKEIERILQDAENKNSKAATDLVEFYKRRHDFNSAIIGTTLGIIITAMLTRDDDDEFLNQILNEEPGSGKLVSKLIQQAPLAYLAGMVKKYGLAIGLKRGLYDIFVSRYPSANEKNRDFAQRLENATKDATIEKIKDEAFYSNIVLISDLFTVPIPEMFRTFRDFSATDKTWSPSPKRAKPDDVFEALFNKGMIRAILESTYDFGIYEQSKAQKDYLKRNEELKAKREKK